MLKRLAIALLAICSLAAAQGVVRYDNTMTYAGGQPGSLQPLYIVPGSTVYVCTGDLSACNSPGTATLYSDSGATDILTQPLTTDSDGKIGFWWAPGNTYTITATPPSGSGSSVQTWVVTPGPTTSNEFSVSTQVPAGTPSGTVTVVGTAQSTTYYYWVVSDFTIGNSAPTLIGHVTTAASTLTTYNYDALTWTAVSGANTYDVLRTTNSTAPTGACGCAVATSVSGTTQNDQSNSLSDYTVSTYAGDNTIHITNDATGPGASQLTLSGGGAGFSFDSLTTLHPSITPTTIQSAVFADQETGSNGGVKIQACINAAQASGWPTPICDARNMTGAQTTSSTITDNGKPIELLLSPAMTLSGPSPVIQFTGNGSEVYGSPSDNWSTGYGATLKPTAGSSGPALEFGNPATSAGCLGCKFGGLIFDLSNETRPAATTIAASSGIACTSNVCTVTTTTANGLTAGQMVTIAGNGTSANNSDFKVESVPTSTTFTIYCPLCSAGSNGTAQQMLVGADTEAWFHGSASNFGWTGVPSGNIGFLMGVGLGSSQIGAQHNIVTNYRAMDGHGMLSIVGDLGLSPAQRYSTSVILDGDAEGYWIYEVGAFTAINATEEGSLPNGWDINDTTAVTLAGSTDIEGAPTNGLLLHGTVRSFNAANLDFSGFTGSTKISGAPSVGFVNGYGISPQLWGTPIADGIDLSSGDYCFTTSGASDLCLVRTASNSLTFTAGGGNLNVAAPAGFNIDAANGDNIDIGSNGNDPVVLGSNTTLSTGKTLTATGATISGGTVNGTTMEQGSQALSLSGANGISAGTVTLSAGAGSHTFTTAYSAAPVCTATDTTAANAVKITSSTTAVTLAGTTSDVIAWQCYPATN